MSQPLYVPDTSLLKEPEPDPEKREPSDEKEYDAATVDMVMHFLEQGFTKASVAEAYDVTQRRINDWVRKRKKELEEE